jgi:hypothetical protein
MRQHQGGVHIPALARWMWSLLFPWDERK